jgi:cytochrome P450
VASTGEENAILEPLLGPTSVLMLDGPEHARQRRLLSPLFHGEPMRRQGDAIAAIAASEVGRWPVGRPFPLLPRMRDVTFEVILRVVFGSREPAELDLLSGLLRRLLRMGSSWMVIPALRRDLGALSPWGRFVRVRARVDGLLRAEIGRRRRPGAPPGDGALDLLLDGMSDDELVDALMTMLVAGHETTATSLAWAFELLLRRPDLVARVRDERATGSVGLLDAVIRETLRMRPVFRYTSRRLKEPLVLGMYTIPSGLAVGANVYLAHMRAADHDEPARFLPERFLDGARPGGAWVPFGGGARRCLGASFAVYEMGIVLRTVLGLARLRPASAHPEAIALHAITLVPRHGARVVMDGRAEGGAP